MFLLIILLFFVTVFTLAVLCVTLFKHCSAKDAAILCRDFLAETFCAVFSEETQPVFYPTIVGWDGYHILPQLVDTEFCEVRKNFTVCFCTRAKISSDWSLVCYEFSIQRKPDTLDDQTLSQIIQKQAEETVAITMRLYDCYLPTEPLTVIELTPSVLRVAFARNESGVRQISDYKRKLHRRSMAASRSEAHSAMSESWNHRG